jgi:hypothetical protein
MGLGCQFPSGLGCQFPVRNTKWLKNGKLRMAILSAFYNILQRNFGILLILWCSFKLWWKFCLDQNLVYNANGPLSLQITLKQINNHTYFYNIVWCRFVILVWLELPTQIMITLESWRNMLQPDGIVLQKSCSTQRVIQKQLMSGLLGVFWLRCCQTNLSSLANIVSFCAGSCLAN